MGVQLPLELSGHWNNHMGPDICLCGLGYSFMLTGSLLGTQEQPNLPHTIDKTLAAPDTRRGPGLQ